MGLKSNLFLQVGVRQLARKHLCKCHLRRTGSVQVLCALNTLGAST